MIPREPKVPDHAAHVKSMEFSARLQLRSERAEGKWKKTAYLVRMVIVQTGVGR